MSLNILESNRSEGDPIGHVVNPYVVGGSVIALKCKGGIIMATDTLLSYGGLLKYNDVCRYEKIADNLLITATGQYADFQEVTRKLKNMSKEGEMYDDRVKFAVKDYANYLAKLCYAKRNKMNPYFNNVVVAGYDNDQSFLGSVDLYGNFIVKDYVVAGFAKHFGLALIANNWDPTKTYEECQKILRGCFQIIYQRDCHSVDQVQFAHIGPDGVKVEAPEKIESTWAFKEFKERANEKLWQ